MKKNNNKKDPIKDRSRQLAQYARYSGLAFQMIAMILIVLYGGIKLDEYLEFEFPLFTLIGALGGVVLAIYFAVKDFMRPNNGSKPGNKDGNSL
ncbi:MAG: AtpZ/AtpI family protein [Marinifilaceae bacterium]